MKQNGHRAAAVLHRHAASSRSDDLQPHKLSDDAAWLATLVQSDQPGVGYRGDTGWPASDQEQPVSLLRRGIRLCRGWYCRLRLDRHDAGPMVHILWNFGELRAAIEACKTILVNNPQHVYAYIHIIDLAARELRDFSRAHKYYLRGLSTLICPRDRELLASFYLYTATVNSPLGG